MNIEKNDENKITIKLRDEDVKFENDTYSYFACTCADEDTAFWNDVVSKIANLDGEQSTGLIYMLSHGFNGVVDSLWADMWMGFSVNAGKYKLHITCDQLHYGLAAAIVILSKLEPENAKEYDLEDFINL